MTPDEQPIRIIGNESNHVFEIEPEAAHAAPEKEKTSEPSAANDSNTTTERHNDEVATNDGAVIETLDTAFHNKPGVAQGENLSGSDRADYYEAHSQGKSDAQEELDALNEGEQH